MPAFSDKTLLFLGYGPQETALIDAIRERGWTVVHTAEKVDDFSSYDVVVSFGYRHILKPAVLATARRPVINLHIAYLPYNRGAHPLFWACMDGTPLGVTIHEIDEGVDTGPICFQKRVELDAGERTFALGYRRLIVDLEQLFIDNIDALLEGRCQARAQEGAGTLHRARDLPSGFSWEDDIQPTIARLKASA